MLVEKPDEKKELRRRRRNKKSKNILCIERTRKIKMKE